jgi:hypothetical protein
LHFSLRLLLSLSHPQGSDLFPNTVTVLIGSLGLTDLVLTVSFPISLLLSPTLLAVTNSGSAYTDSRDDS